MRHKILFSVFIVLFLTSIPTHAHWLEKHKKAPRLQEREDNQLSEKGNRNLVHHDFSVPEALKHSTQFWKLIYSKYSGDEAVIHDTENLQVIYSSMKKGAGVDAEKERIRKTLLKLAAGGYEEKDLNAEEKQIFHLFDSVSEPEKFKAAAAPGRIRSQTGQKDKFVKAIETSGRYLSEIEDIFSSQGLPIELTRIIFVESMFNLNARSKVGASGIWQFMPQTAKLFIQVNGMVDERNDPIHATQAAARLLQANFNTLGSWPLAINAYNAGAATLLNAKRDLGTDDIGIIATKYRGGAYQFASRNFYPEFLAALEVANHYQDYFGEIQRNSPLEYEVFALEKSMSLIEMAETAHLDLDKVEELNPGLHSTFFSSRKPLPNGYLLKVPQGMSAQIKKRLEEFAGR